MPELVTEPAALDARWLTDALREAGALPQGRVRDVASRVIGHGKMGDNVRYELTYEGARGDPPRSLVAKLPAADPTARASAAAQGLYAREVCFYREVAPHIPLRTPGVHMTLIDESGADFVILMEDLAPAEPGDQIEGCGPERAELALREVAKLHAPLVGETALCEAEWVGQPAQANLELGQTVLQQLWPGFVARFENAMTPEGIALADRFTKSFVTWAQGFAGPRTLVHSDYRLENVLFGTEEGGPPIAVVDWQSVQNASPLVDVAYFLGGGLPVALRRAHERELLEIYRRELAALGVAIDADACWQLYRQSSLHGILITVLGCMLSGQDERGDRMFAAMIERHLQHALDLDGQEFLA